MSGHLHWGQSPAEPSDEGRGARVSAAGMGQRAVEAERCSGEAGGEAVRDSATQASSIQNGVQYSSYWSMVLTDRSSM